MPTYKFATYDPPSDIGQLINKLTSSISTYEKEHPKLAEHTSTYLTDRRYFQRNDSYRSARTKPPKSFRTHTSEHDAQYKPRSRCFIYQREGYRS
jgi:hypothetical protein